MSVLAFIAIMVTFVVGGAATVRAADAAAPGDPLYAIDIAVEQVQLAFTRSPEKRAELLAQLAQERLNEIQVLEARGRVDQIPVAAERLNRHLSELETTASQIPETQRAEVVQQVRQINEASQQVLQVVAAITSDITPVPGTSTPEPTPVGTVYPDDTVMEFVGVVEAMDGDQWTIDGKLVLVTGAKIEGNIQVGDTVKVKAFDNGDGTYTALEIEWAEQQSDDISDDDYDDDYDATGDEDSNEDYDMGSDDTYEDGQNDSSGNYDDSGSSDDSGNYDDDDDHDDDDDDHDDDDD